MENNSKWQERIPKILEMKKLWHSHTRIALELWTDAKMIWTIMQRPEYKEAQSLQSNTFEKELDGNNFPHNWDYWWLKWENASIFIRNPKEAENLLESVREIIEWHDFRPIEYTAPTEDNKKAIKVTISDAHVGLNPNPDNNGLFTYEYNWELFSQHMDSVYEKIQSYRYFYGVFDLLLLQDLWDPLDWWNGETTRWWHKLDQNMTNEIAFKTYVRANINLIENIIRWGIAKKIIVRNVLNDNHSGDFARIAAFTISEVITRLYWDIIEFQSMNRFMQHYIYWDHCFVITHWKDEKHMMKWLPFTLNDKAINFINQYLDHYGINSKHIHIEKWDLHRLGYERNVRFDYRNYMSFAPWSAWVAHNFGDTYSGYSIDIIAKDSNETAHQDFFLDYKKVTL